MNILATGFTRHAVYTRILMLVSNSMLKFDTSFACMRRPHRPRASERDRAATGRSCGVAV